MRISWQNKLFFWFLGQLSREEIEINRNLNDNTSLSRDLGEYTLNPMYTRLVIEDILIQNKTKIETNKTSPIPKELRE